MTGPYDDLRVKIDPLNPIGSAFENETAIAERLRQRHASDLAAGYDWGTWANVMRVRNGTPPVRPQSRNRAKDA